MLYDDDSVKDENMKVYLNGIQKFIDRGVPVYIDGVNVEKCGLNPLLSSPEGTFYMADFVMEEYPSVISADTGRPAMVRESARGEGLYDQQEDHGRYFLKEIRFDLVYHS